MATRLNIPVIGSGSIGTRHHNNLLEQGVDSELLSFRTHGMNGVEKYLKRGTADGIVIATATDVRNELISLCVSANLPMYIEKPLAFTTAQISELYTLCPDDLKSRSIAGYMMRYHPLMQWLSAQDLRDVYRFNLTIGHDVNQWRSNWKFADSYSSKAQGGGVLLDLCHELDMAHTLFPAHGVCQVNCLGHQLFPGVDFSATIELTNDGNPAGNGCIGSVSMDYLCPVPVRVAEFFGLDNVIKIDFNSLTRETVSGDVVNKETLTFERNTMFTHTMRDFIKLVRHEPASKFAPTLNSVRSSAELIARAWEQRQFVGNVDYQVA